MPYQQITFTINERHAEELSDALMAHGALSAAIEDAYAGTDGEQPIFGEPGMAAEQVWQNSKILALFAKEADPAAALAAAADTVGIPAPAFAAELVPEQDWVRLTQSQFDPIRISDRLRITPTWHDAPADAPDDLVNLRLDPGLAFGTGSHPTTRLCLQWLDNKLRLGERVLDYGCGSGILAIAALKLGAAAADGADIDPQAVAAAEANAAQNGAAARFFLPDALPQGEYDVVLANILANPLRMLADMLAARTRSGGRIVLSGLLAEQSDELAAIYGRWFDIDPVQTDEGWACLSGVKR